MFATLSLVGCEGSSLLDLDFAGQNAGTPTPRSLPGPTQSYVLGPQGALVPREQLTEAHVYARHGEWLQVGFHPAQFIRADTFPEAQPELLGRLSTGSSHTCPLHAMDGSRLNRVLGLVSGELDVYDIYDNFAQIIQGDRHGWVACPCVTPHEEATVSDALTPEMTFTKAFLISDRPAPGRPQAVQSLLAGWATASEFEREARLLQLSNGWVDGLEGSVFYPQNDPWNYQGCGDLKFKSWSKHAGSSVVNQTADLYAHALGLEDFISVLIGDITFTSVDGGEPTEVRQYTRLVRSKTATGTDYFSEGAGSLCRVLYRLAICAQSMAPNATSMVHVGTSANAGVKQKYTSNYGDPKATCNDNQWTIPLDPFVCEDGLSGRDGSTYRLYWSPRGWQ